MKTTLFIGLALCAAGSFAANPEQVARVMDGTLKEARASWWGFDPQDSTAALQAAIHSRVPRLIVDNMGAPWITDRLTGVSDQEIFFEPGAEVLAKKGAFTNKVAALLTLAGVTNVTLRGPGATLRMRRADYDAPPYVRAEWRHTLSIKSSANIRVIGLTLAESGGDGIYLGSLRDAWPNRDILIRDVVCDRNYRQGISVISAENLLIENTVMRDTAGTPPAAGIDFEPNKAGERLKNCVMRNCLTENNFGEGYLFAMPYLTAASEPVSIRLENCRSVGDRSALRVITGNAETDAVRGTMTVEGCRFEQARRNAVLIAGKPAHGMALTLDRCVIAGCGADTNAFADLQLSSHIRDRRSVGGIRFNDVIIEQPVARPWIVCQSGGTDAHDPVADLSGTVTLRQPGTAEQRIALTPAWIAQTFPPRFTVRVPRVAPALASARVVDNAEGLQSLTPLRLRHGGTYLFHAQAGAEVVFAGQQTQVGRYAPAAKPLIVRAADGRVIKSVPMPTFRERAELRFMPQTAGFYTLEVNVGANAFSLLEATVPVAFDTSKTSVSLIASTGSLYAVVPKGTALFAFGVSGGGGSEGVKSTVYDPTGRTVWSHDAITQPERYTATGGEGAAGGLWRITFARPARGVFEDFHVDVLGIPPYLFLHPDRYWTF